MPHAGPNEPLSRHDKTLDYDMTNMVASGADHPAVVAVEKQLRAWRKVTAIKSLDIKRKSPAPFNNDMLELEYEHQDGRTFVGAVDFTTDPLAPFFSYTLSPGWTVAESLSPALREALFNAHVQLGMIELHVTWN